MNYRWAINKDGVLTQCTAKPENIGKGRCNHFMHSHEGESAKELFFRYKEISKIEHLISKEFKDYYYVEVKGFGDYPPLLRKPKDEIFITNAQIYNRNTSEWENNPDKWHNIVDMNDYDYNLITPEEAFYSSTKLDNKVIDFCKIVSKNAHSDQKDKNGEPYYLHPIAVAKLCNNDLSKASAYLHDVIEDTSFDRGKLEAIGIPESVISKVEILTHDPSEPYMDYIQRVSKDPIASEVKYYDLKHNTDLIRSDNEIKVSKKKWDYYQESLKLLNDKYHFELSEE